MSERQETPFNAAQQGDICLILEPTEHELLKLRQRQACLQARFGGQIYPKLHVTCQRFATADERRLTAVLVAFDAALSSVTPFQIETESLALFYAPFWGSHVLKWVVQPSPSWLAFRAACEDTLVEMGCAPHYPSEQPATCTALVQVPMVAVDELAEHLGAPFALFGARRVILSQIEGSGGFTILREYDLSAGSTASTGRGRAS